MEQDGNTIIIQEPKLRLGRHTVIGLFNASTKTLHRFDQCLMEGQPKRILIIGRSKDCDIQVLDRAASLIHCNICREGDRHTVLDAQSTNGLYVNDIRVTSAKLMPGTWILVGDTELIAVGPDEAIPFMARNERSLLAKAASIYGSLRRAARFVGRSHTAVANAKRHHGDQSR